MKTAWFFAALVALATMATPGAAQFSERYEFFKAVKDGDAAEVKALMEKPGSVIVNSRERDTGQTALHIVTDRKDPSWINFLYQAGANPNVQDQQGNTPLHIASAKRFTDGIQLLLAYGARVNEQNSSGETPLIYAVQRLDGEAVRLLLRAGADAEQTDHTGLSARDYATRNPRARRILDLIETVEAPEQTVSGPVL
ncbi:MAG: ankyrin repeat domain-containing protein [Pacificimonas sp.]